MWQFQDHLQGPQQKAALDASHREKTVHSRSVESSGSMYTMRKTLVAQAFLSYRQAFICPVFYPSGARFTQDCHYQGRGGIGVGWDLSKTIHKMKLKRLYRRIPIHDIQYLGIDEFSIRKGYEYMTIFVDLTTGRIVHAVEGKYKESVTPFLKKLARVWHEPQGYCHGHEQFLFLGSQ